MALTKKIEYKGFETPAYAKITEYDVREEKKEDGTKEYNSLVTVNTYTNSTKEYDIDQKDYLVKDLKEDDCNLATLYSKLKELPAFEGWVDA